MCEQLLLRCVGMWKLVGTATKIDLTQTNQLTPIHIFPNAFWMHFGKIYVGSTFVLLDLGNNDAGTFQCEYMSFRQFDDVLFKFHYLIKSDI